MLFATLEIEAGTVLRPGDFVKVAVEEPELANVVAVPAAAVTEDGRLLVVTEDERIDEIRARVLRRMGNEVLLADVPFGTDYVRERLPQLGKGLKVSPRRGQGEEPEDTAPVTASASESAGQPAGDLVALEPERRAALIAQLTNSNMPENRKARLLALLNEPMVPKDLVDRLEERQGRKG